MKSQAKLAKKKRIGKEGTIYEEEGLRHKIIQQYNTDVIGNFVKQLKELKAYCLAASMTEAINFIEFEVQDWLYSLQRDINLLIYKQPLLPEWFQLPPNLKTKCTVAYHEAKIQQLNAGVEELPKISKILKEMIAEQLPVIKFEELTTTTRL